MVRSRSDRLELHALYANFDVRSMDENLAHCSFEAGVRYLLITKPCRVLSD